VRFGCHDAVRSKSGRDGMSMLKYHKAPDLSASESQMRMDIARAATLVIGAALFATPVFAAPPAGKLAPEVIQSTFFTGQPFTASSPSNVRFKMTFTPDGKIKRVPIGKGNRGEGTWKLSKDGFCTSWKGGKDSCFTLVSAGANKWTVLKGSTIMATWSK
jgi:hypothetical protein